MSLTLNTTYVTGVDPVYNPINFIVSSNLSSRPNFKYIFDLFNGNTNIGTLMSTIKLNPRPNGSCQYNPARILESICSADLLIANITAVTPSQNSDKQYTVLFKEQFSGSGVNDSVHFIDNTFNFTPPFFANVGFILDGPNPFVTGTTVLITQEQGAINPQYSGVHTIVQINGNVVIIDVPFSASTPLNPGYINYYSGVSATTFSAYTFNGVLEYMDYPSWNPNLYEVKSGNTNSLYLTNQPRSGVYVHTFFDTGTLSFLSLIPSGSTGNSVYIQYVTYDASGTATGTGTSTNFNIINNTYHIPAGPKNINTFLSTLLINQTTSYYTIQIKLASNNTSLTEALTYLIDTRCSKYTPVRLQFLNRLGAWDYVNFDMVSRKTVNLTKRDTYKKNLPVGYVVGDREKTLIDIDGNYIYTLTSNWMNNAQSAWIEELFTSQNVNIINLDGSSWPVNIQENSLEIQKTINQHMISYTFALESAYQVNTGRA